MNSEEGAVIDTDKLNAEALAVLIQRAGGELFIPHGPDIKTGATWAKIEEDGVRFRFSPQGSA